MMSYACHPEEHDLAKCIVCGSRSIAGMGAFTPYEDLLKPPGRQRVQAYLICTECAKDPMEASRRIDEIMVNRLGLYQ